MECPRAELLFTRLDFLSEKFGERLRLYFVSGAGLTGGGGHHIELTSSSPDYDEWADPGRVLLHCGIFFPQINHCIFPACVARADQIRLRWEVLFCFREAQREFSPGLILWNWWSDYYHPHSKDWQALSESDQVQHLPIAEGKHFQRLLVFLFLHRREWEGEGGKCCGPNTPLFTENSRVWRPNLKGQQLFWWYPRWLWWSSLTLRRRVRKRQSSNRRHLI